MAPVEEVTANKTKHISDERGTRTKFYSKTFQNKMHKRQTKAVKITVYSHIIVRLIIHSISNACKHYYINKDPMYVGVRAIADR